MPSPTRGWAPWYGLLVVVTVLALLALHGVERVLAPEMAPRGTERRCLRILTWNIGKLYLSWESRASDRDLSHVARVIRSVDPDVVALQELRGPEQLGQLATKLGPRWRAMVPEDRYDRRAGLLTPLSARFVPLPTSTGRTAQAAVIEFGGTSFTVVSLHLDAFEPARRLVQAEEILAGAARLGDEHLVLAGDFNFDASVVAQDSTDQRLYRFLTGELADAGKDAGATTVVSRRLDYVFVRGPGITRVRASVLRDKRINIMDHDPLVVELHL